MGYFSNATEGMLYEERWCMRCLHYERDEKGCPVWQMHLMWNYDRYNTATGTAKVAQMLGSLIPRTEDGLGNEQCTMFIANS
jgi:hypothetical protein